MKHLIITTCIISSSLFLMGQVRSDAAPYNFAAGARVGLFTAATAKYFLLEKIALEAIAGIQVKPFSSGIGPQVTLLVEFYHPHVFDVDNLYLFYGGGLSTGYQTYNTTDTRTGAVISSSYGYMGTDGIFGFEYNFTELLNFPVAASADIKPGLEIFPTPRIGFGSPSISVRYIFR